MPLYRRKSTVVETIQYKNGVNFKGLYKDELDQSYIITIHDQITYIKEGDWIITEPDGVHHYPIKDEIFKSLYDASK